ncbi:KpsF/GutQ family protein [Jimgerdemannia flammicorona]|uniref:KpsF/GutQ family protein n=2 Tax=Jimgerdemannia flammicorona TaxID=994334 RepID=A0A433R092_9FUNG|nr:KpsF/GutQ family protein [Jimgerdemannia flammicorona]RUS35448.1 KpsF/GutQ family protein [Jimgerdemannia flammicorona]
MPVMTSDQMVTEAARILRSEAHALLDAADRLQQDPHDNGYHKAIFHLFRAVDQGGKIVVTGVGKSGKIAEKIVVTLQSTGSCAVYLHPTEALHGDLGVIGAKDAVLALSFSGNTEEILRLLPSLKHRGVPIIGLGGNTKSKLARECDVWLDGYVKSEACTHIPAPTSSTTLALAIGDALALTLCQLRGFTKEHFALNHPGGSLGRKLLLKVKDVMVRNGEVATVEPGAFMDTVIAEATKKPRCGAVLVMEPVSPLPGGGGDKHANAKIVGVITNGDIRRAIAFRERVFQLRASDVMSRDLVTCSNEDMASEAKRLMEERPDGDTISMLPVLDKSNRWKGVVTLRDLEDLL